MINQRTKAIPIKPFTGREFESLVNKRCAELRTLQVASIAKYGVMCSIVGMNGGRPDVMVHRSFPDFEGTIDMYGCQTIFDAKARSDASFALGRYSNDTGSKKNHRLQLIKMYERSAFGCPCFFLIHWNERQLKTKTEPAETYAFPVHRRHVFWDQFERREVKSIKRKDCEEYAIEVPWTIIGQGRTPRPDVLGAALSIRTLITNSRYVLRPEMV